MDKFIVNEKAVLVENVLITSESILGSSKNYETRANFLEKINAGKKGVLDTHYKIENNDIIKIIPTESDFALQVFFKNGNKEEKTYFEFNSLEEYTEVKTHLLEKTKLESSTETENSISVWGKKALYTLIAFIVSGATYSMAISLEKGERISVTGGRRGLKKLLVLAAETLGSTNTLVLGIIVVSAFVYWTYSSYKQGKKEIEVYS